MKNQKGQLKDRNISNKIVAMENKNSLLQIDLEGGSYFDFHLKSLPINPINFRANNPLEPPFKGHFVCFDRWGPPSNGERKHGFDPHGEINSQTWDLIDYTKKENFITESLMRSVLPMAGLQLTRKIQLSDVDPIFLVTEKIKNLNKNGRIFNIVQHVTLGPPFLNTSTIFDNNTEKGFENREDGSLNQEEPILNWPSADYNNEKVTLRHFRNKWPRVSSFVYNQNDKYGWTTACNPKEKLMLGYIWKINQYPWINYWRSMNNGTPVAFGMEFGTTGLHEPFPILAKKGKIFDRNIYDFIDADEVKEKSFVGFLSKIPEDYKGVENVQIKESVLIIKEKGMASRDITYRIDDLLFKQIEKR